MVTSEVEHLPHFDGNHAAADDNQGFWETVQMEGGVACEKIDISQTRQADSARNSAAGDQKPVADDDFGAHLKFSWGEEAAMAAQDFDPGIGCQHFFVIFPPHLCHGLLLGSHQPPAIRNAGSQVHSEGSGTAGLEIGLCLVDQCLARDAAPVDTGAAQFALLNHQDSGPLAGSLQSTGEG